MKIVKQYKKIKNKLDKYSPRPILYSFIMSKGEKDLFKRWIKSSLGYLEFGMGGSTIYVLRNSNAKVYSIDSSLTFIDKMREYIYIRFMEKTGRLKLFHVDIGPTTDWGIPINSDQRNNFPNYSSYIFNLVNKNKIDIVLIDGRFRVASTLKTILELNQNDNLCIIIHDFWKREKYHIVLKYLHEVESAENLGVFSIKKDIDFDLVKKDYEKFKYIPD